MVNKSTIKFSLIQFSEMFFFISIRINYYIVKKNSKYTYFIFNLFLNIALSLYRAFLFRRLF